MSRVAIGWGCLGLLMLAAIYCLPDHPSAGRAAGMDAVLHVALFAVIGGWFGWFAGTRARVFVPLALLAALLEVAQWWIAGLSRVEWNDVIANEAGLAVALLVLWRRPRSRTLPTEPVRESGKPGSG